MNIPYCKLIVILTYYLIKFSEITIPQWWIGPLHANKMQLISNRDKIFKGLVFDITNMQFEYKELMVVMDEIYEEELLIDESESKYKKKHIIDFRYLKSITPEYIYLKDGSFLVVSNNPWVYHKFKHPGLNIKPSSPEDEGNIRMVYPIIDVSFSEITTFSRTRSLFLSGANMNNMFNLDEIHFPSELFKASKIFNLKIFIFGKKKPIICTFNMRSSTDIEDWYYDEYRFIPKCLLVNTDSGILVIPIPLIIKIEIVKTYNRKNIDLLEEDYIYSGTYKESASTLRDIRITKQIKFSQYRGFFYLLNNIDKIIRVTSVHWLVADEIPKIPDIPDIHEKTINRSTRIDFRRD